MPLPRSMSCALCAMAAIALAGCNSPGAGGASAAGKIDPHIQEMIETLRAEDVTAANAAGRSVSDYSTPLVKVDDRARIHVYVHVDDVDTAAGPLEQHGARIELTDAERDIVQAWVPAEYIRALAAQDFVKGIEAPAYASLR